MRPRESEPARTAGSTASAGRVFCAPGVVAMVVLAAVLAGVTIESVVAVAIVLMDGVAAWVVLLAAALAGGWVLPALGLGQADYRERFILGAAAGVGLLSLIVFGLGSAGLLTGPTAIGLCVLLAGLGIARLTIDLRGGAIDLRGGAIDLRGSANDLRGGANDLRGGAKSTENASGWYWLWALAGPFLVITLLAASLPPGILWREEALGYDVLAYHLAVPKTWFEQGHIAILPNNVYSAFPFNDEMLSLLMMTLRGDAVEATFMAKMVNVALAGLFVATAWLVGRRWDRRTGAVTGVAAAVWPWLSYLSAMAYVEPGMLAMGLAAMAALLQADRDGPRFTRWVALGGLLAGLACGFKYTAVPLLALPMVLLIPAARVSWRRWLPAMGVFFGCLLITFGPWLLRNALVTGNPVYPLAYQWFGARDGWWDADLQERWHDAHESAEMEKADSPVWWRALGRTLGEFRHGQAIFALGIGGLIALRDRKALALAAMLVCQVGVWVAATHLFARFIVVMAIPLIGLAAGLGKEMDRRYLRILVILVLFVDGSKNLYRLAGLYYHHTRLGVPATPVDAYGQTDWFVEGQWPGTRHVGLINLLGEDARVMLVGEARTFYIERACASASAFNHHPLGQAALEIADDEALLAWLADRGFTHVLFHWDELSRLEDSYGLPGGLNVGLLPRLEAAGLKQVASVTYAEGQPAYATLFEVPDHE